MLFLSQKEVSDQPLILKGRMTRKVWTRHGAIQFADVQELQPLDNLLVDGGRDSILQTWGNKTLGFVNQIGIGDSNTGAATGQTDLQATVNKLWKGCTADDVTYVSHGALYLNIILNYNEGNFTIREYGVRDSNNVMTSRLIDNSPTTKNNTQLLQIQWEYTM